MKDPSPVSSPKLSDQLSDQPAEAPLDSWKEIAAYVKRDVTTVQRWERREGMPVHRHLHDKQGSVYAFCSELDSWLAGRRVATAQSEEASSEGTGVGPATGEAVSSHDIPHRGDSAEE